ncbi:hypothetical protein [Halomonas stenophila]|uniref:Membrane protein implicated in regulation of membrane protease activity n=1 Tax=Halomonas stenophila TaxID=795312 RepID=A0A7W5ER60_9GAMM|nr:hypothetical protein [Halomonas stenophila]MBB3229290.1 membrane protein implicated in regulation of membrane protease activity [Halomonas stenophila]
MNTLIDLATSFPLVVFTGLLVLLAVYWLLVLLRLAPTELFEHDSLKEEHLASTMVSLGFAGVPVSLALSVLIVLAGGLTLVVELAVLRWLPLGLFRIPLGVLVLWGAFALASPLAAGLCQRLHPRLHRAPERLPRCLLGERVRVTAEAGADGRVTAVLDEDDRHEVVLLGKPGHLPRPGERYVLVKYLPEADGYRAVPERDFLDAHTRLMRLHMRKRHRRPGGRNGSASSA